MTAPMMTSTAAMMSDRRTGEHGCGNHAEGERGAANHDAGRDSEDQFLRIGRGHQKPCTHHPQRVNTWSTRRF